MLDNILNTVKRGAEKVQRRGEEVAHAARLRMEVFQLGRELDGLYARLGRSYHAGAEAETLEGVQSDIRRVEEEIAARERLIQELGEAGAPLTDEPARAPGWTAQKPGSASGLPPATSATQETTPVTRPNPAAPDPTMPHSDEKLPPQGDTASMGNEPGRDPQRHENTLDQADTMKGHNDPLDK